MKRTKGFLGVAILAWCFFITASAASSAETKCGRVTADLAFTFNSADYPWSAEELQTLQQEVADFYPLIKKVYGDPSEGGVVNIEKNPTLSYDAQFDPSANTIWLQGIPDPDRLCHEMIHAFHGEFMIGNNVFEEGMTRAAEVAVMNLLPQYAYWDRHHQYGIDIFYDAQNEPGIASQDGNFFLGFPNLLLKYQQAGYAWAKMFLEDRLFFRKFNQRYYLAAAMDPGVSGNVGALAEIVKAVKPRVEGARFQEWYAGQWIFDMNPPAGYQTFFKHYDYIFYVYYRDENGAEFPLPDVAVRWNVYGCSGEQLTAGAGVTTGYGWIDIAPYGISYEGQILIQLIVSLPEGELSQAIHTLSGVAQDGLFGITPGACGGSVQLSMPKGRVQTMSVVNGAFEFPEAYRAGQYNLTRGGNIKRVTKDEGSYFVSLP